MSPDAAEARRARLLEICQRFPEATVDGDQHLALRVRGKTFAYYVSDHHGDGRIALNCKAGAIENSALVAHDPERYYMPAYLGARGWIGLRLDLEAVDWDEVEKLLVESYLRTAPKRLGSQLHRPAT